ENEVLQTDYFNESGDRWFEVKAVKMNDGVVATFNDITDKKLSSQMLAKGFEDLKKTTQELTSTNSELEKSNYDLLQFASVVSHDLKEPLRKIQTFGNLLQIRYPDKLQRDDKNYL